jgi:hypothetical protein
MVSKVLAIVVKFCRRGLTVNISPWELSNHPLPDLCIDNITK